MRCCGTACPPEHPGSVPIRSFKSNPNGKPYLANQGIDLQFNLSHTDGLVACVVVRDGDCGIDVEAVRSDLDLPAAVLAPSEQRLLAEAPSSTRAELFFRLWTLKEAYVKARGLWFSLPVERCVFSLGDDVVLTMELEGQRPSGWQFYECTPSPGYRLSCALHFDGEEPFQVLRHFGEPTWRERAAPKRRQM